MISHRFMKSTWLLLLIAPAVAFTTFDALDSIATALRSGNSRELARYFDSNVDITVMDRESTYSKVQAEMVLRDLFAKSPVKGFDIIHRGTNGEGAAFAIGKMRTATNEYRVYYSVRLKGSQSLIQEMRFEKP